MAAKICKSLKRAFAVQSGQEERQVVTMTDIIDLLRTQPNAAAVLTAGVIAAFITLAVGILTVWVNSRTKKDEMLISSLQHFQGGTQRRAIAISVVDGYIQSHKTRFREVIAPMMIAQALYLLNEKENYDAHEKYNIYRIVSILNKLQDMPRYILFDHHRKLIDEIIRAYQRRNLPDLKEVAVADFFV